METSSSTKGWLRRSKKSGEKPSVVPKKSSLPLKPEDDEEIHILLIEKEELEKNLKILKDKLDSALLDSNAKDSLAKNHGKTAEEATEGRERAEARVRSLKHELKEALQQKASGEERITQLDAALKECMQQLRFVRDDQEKRIHDAVTRASLEFDESQMILEQKLADTGKRLTKLGVENTQLNQTLIAKEKLIRELNNQKAQVESDLKALAVSLDFTEKDNASLKYEVRVLEKELEIRNEEREFSRRTADAMHKQHLESVKKIAKLESECQRLRLLVRKRLPGPAAVAKMRSEAEIVGRDSVETNRRRSFSGSTLTMDDSADQKSHTAANKSINLLTEQFNDVKEENKILREALSIKESELQSSRSMFARAASRLSHADSQMYDSPKMRTSSLYSHDISLSSVSEFGSDDKISSAGSISEWEHSRYDKHGGLLSSKTFGGSDMDLMNDFVEMERLAIISVDKQQPESPQVSSNSSSAASGLLKGDVKGPVTGMEIVPVLDSGSRKSNEQVKPNDSASGKDWLQEILSLVLEQNQVTQRKPDDIVEEIRAALQNAEKTSPLKNADANSVNKACKSINKADTMEETGATTDIDVALEGVSKHELHSDMGKSVSKIIELLEGITMQNPAYSCTESLSRKDANSFPYKHTEMTSGYTVRVFQWKTSELSVVLQQVVHTCYDMLSGKCNVNKFAQELTSALDWIMNHCFSLQDVSSMKEAIKKHLDWDSRSEGEAEVGFIGNQNYVEKNEVQISTQDEDKKFQGGMADMLSTKNSLEARFMSATVKRESLTIQGHESEKTSVSLLSELDYVEGSRSTIEAHKVVKDDLDTQLAMAKAELNEARQKLSSLEVELEKRNSCCEELEDTCVDLQLQLESAADNSEGHSEEKQLRTKLEGKEASDKLAECEETTQKMGKQVTAVASAKEGGGTLENGILKADKANAGDGTGKGKLRNQRSSLLDRMIAEDNGKSAVTERMVSSLSRSRRHKDDGFTVNSSSLAVVAGRKRGVGGLWKKLVMKKKKKSVTP
ncbi:Filament-like plant protein 7 [Linum perenne]